MFIFSRLQRAAQIALILALLVLAIPQAAVSAAPNPVVIVTFDVLAVKTDTSVTIRTRDFPIRTKFTVRMDVVGKQAAGGPVVGELASDKGGEIDATFPIPEALRGKVILAIRVESADGYLGTNWFFNENYTSPKLNPKVKPSMAFTEVKKSTSVTVTAKNLLPSTRYSVRVGPYYTFYKDYVFADSFTSTLDGTGQITIPLDKNVQAADYIMVRLDGGGQYVYDVYKNVDGGTSVPISSLYQFQWCRVVNMNVIPALHPGEEFDVTWWVQNVSNTTWNPDHTAYKYLEGEPMHKYEDWHPLGWGPKDGQTFKITLDMIAPQEPGWHSTTWAIYNPAENKIMCKLKVSVPVTDAK